nr:MAG TPA: hypothetical protein [Caudoviricetes sp.]
MNLVRFVSGSWPLKYGKPCYNNIVELCKEAQGYGKFCVKAS